MKTQCLQTYVVDVVQPLVMYYLWLQASLSFTISQGLVKLMSIKLVMLSNHLILCQLILLLPSISSSIRVFSNKFVLCIRWAKYWSFTFNISPSNEYSWSISFRIYWLDLLAAQGTLKRLLQHHNVKASISCTQSSLSSKSDICTWLLENPELWLYKPFSAKSCFLLFNTLFSFVKASVPRIKCLNFMAAVIGYSGF